MPVDANKSKVSNEGKEYPLVPEGMYYAEVADVILEEGVETKWGLKDWFKCYLGVLDAGEFRASSLLYKVSKAFNSGFEGGQASKLYELACAVYGEKLDEEMDFDVNTLIGGKLRIVVKHQEGKKRTYANITEVMKIDAAGKALPVLTDEEKKKVIPANKTESEGMSDKELEDIDKALGQPGFDDVLKDIDKPKK